MEIKVGIHTAGRPRLAASAGGVTILENMLIGKDFHWQTEIRVALPGRIELQEGGGVVNHVPIEQYLECVVGSEMNPDSPPEFLKAHAIVSRSWAVGKILGCHPAGCRGMIDNGEELIGWDDTGQHAGFHVCSDDHCQRYQGLQPIPEVAKEAIRSTEGMILLDPSGHPVDARFSKCCGGRTELFSTCWQDLDMPGLESFEDPWCDLRNLPSGEKDRLLRSVLKDYDLSTSGGYRWISQISKKEVANNLLTKFGRDIGEILELRPASRGPSGRISRLSIIGHRGSLTLGKELWIRRLLSATHLYSSAFEVIDDGDAFQLLGRGWGHGVGLCQIGAARMALEGASCEEILSFYYPSTHIARL